MEMIVLFFPGCIILVPSFSRSNKITKPFTFNLGFCPAHICHNSDAPGVTVVKTYLQASSCGFSWQSG